LSSSNAILALVAMFLPFSVALLFLQYMISREKSQPEMASKIASSKPREKPALDRKTP
jgi:hypothetical protein